MEIDEKYLYEFIQPSYSDSMLNISNFNFEGKCRELFKYKNKKSIQFESNLMNNTIPNAKKVCVIYGNDDELETFVNKCGFETIEIEL